MTWGCFGATTLLVLADDFYWYLSFGDSKQNNLSNYKIRAKTKTIPMNHLTSYQDHTTPTEQVERKTTNKTSIVNQPLDKSAK